MAYATPLPADRIEGTYAIETGDATTAQAIESGLLTALRSTLPQATNTTLTLAARDPQGQLLGGLTAGTSYGWLLIKTLWVDAPHQRRGIGQSLMAQAEAWALSLGCHAAWLDTSNPAARAFYARLGYREFAQLANTGAQFPPTHRRWFLQKELAPAARSATPAADSPGDP